MYSPNTGNPIGIRIECIDAVQFVDQDHRRVDGIASGKRVVGVSESFRAVHYLTRDRKNFRKDRARERIHVPTLSPTIQRPVSMDNFLKYFGIQGGVD